MQWYDTAAIVRHEIRHRVHHKVEYIVQHEVQHKVENNVQRRVQNKVQAVTGMGGGGAVQTGFMTDTCRISYPGRKNSFFWVRQQSYIFLRFLLLFSICSEECTLLAQMKSCIVPYTVPSIYLSCTPVFLARRNISENDHFNGTMLSMIESLIFSNWLWGVASLLSNS